MKRVLSTIAKRVVLTLLNFLLYVVLLAESIFVLLNAFIKIFLNPKGFYEYYCFKIHDVYYTHLRHE